MINLLGEIVCICGSFKSTNHNKLSPQIANPQSATFGEIYKNFKSANLRICDLRYLFADLRLVELICGPPTFVFVVFMQAFYQCVEGLGFIEAEQEELGPGSGRNAERCMLKFCPSDSYHHD